MKIFRGRIVNVSKEIIDETVHGVGFKDQRGFKSFGWGYENGYGGITIYGKRQNYVCFKCVIYINKNENQTIKIYLRDEILDYFDKTRITDKMVNILKGKLEGKKTKFKDIYGIRKNSYNYCDFENLYDLLEED